MSDKLIKLSDAIEAVYQLRHKPNDDEWNRWLESLNSIPPAVGLNIDDIIRLINKESFREDISEQVRQYLFYDLRHKLWNIKVSQWKGERGKWVDRQGNAVPMTEHSAFCSNCGEWSEYLTNYCGCRGADMRDPAAADGSAWIPCAERLPSEQGQYLVTFPLCNGEPWVDVLNFCKGKFYETDDEWGDVEYDDVTAWMPLPEPWKGANNENKD